MRPPIHIVVPMAGYGSRFSKAGYRDPKPLIDVFKKTMIEQVIDNLKPKSPFKFIFICQKTHFTEYGLADIFEKSLGSDWDCHLLEGVTEGAACTVLTARKLIPENAEMIIANSDQIVDRSMEEFISSAREHSADGYIMTFPANETKWSYARLDEAGLCVEVAEKKVISEHATVGIYYFASAGQFFRAADSMIKKDIRVNGEFYVAPVYNEMVLNGLRIKIWEIRANEMNGIGTPEDLTAFFEKRGGYQSRSAPGTL